MARVRGAERRRLDRERIQRVAVGIDRCGHGAQPVKPGTAFGLMRHVSADLHWRRNDGVAGAAGGHEGVEIGDRARGDADLGNAAVSIPAARSASACTSASEGSGTQSRLASCMGIPPFEAIMTAAALRGKRGGRVG